MPLSPKDFGASFQQFMDQMASQAGPQEPVFVSRLREHFGTEPTSLPIVSETFAEHDHPNLQLAIDSHLKADGRTSEVIGIISEHAFFGASLSALVAPTGSGMYRGPGASIGPVKYTNIALDGDRVLTCVQCGLFLIEEGEKRLAVLLQGPVRERHYPKGTVEVMAADKTFGEEFLAELRNSIRTNNVYRGRVLSVGQDELMRTLKIEFHHLPEIPREGIILPDGLLDRIERQTVRFSVHSERLLQQGRHLKRGLLLHGPPGTGKTLTAMYLCGAMEGRTVLLLTGRRDWSKTPETTIRAENAHFEAVRDVPNSSEPAAGLRE